MTDDLRQLILSFMLWVLLPVWVIAGITDYALHRRTSIETTSGIGESNLHLLQAAQIGVLLFLGLFLESTALVLWLMILVVIAHTVTSLWDASYTAPRRYISPLEQHVHSHLEYVPLVAVSLVVLLNWSAFAQVPDFSLHWRQPALPWSYVVAVIGPVLLVQGVLLAEETVRVRR